VREHTEVWQGRVQSAESRDVVNSRQVADAAFLLDWQHLEEKKGFLGMIAGPNRGWTEEEKKAEAGRVGR
jgi:hypothetical protein